MKSLEDRYRRVLSLLPGYYRSEWEEEMVGTFIQSVQTDDLDELEYRLMFGRIPMAELGSVVALAARLRLGGSHAPPRSFAWGEAIRIFALVTLLVNAWIAVANLFWSAWFLADIPWPRELAAVYAELEERVPMRIIEPWMVVGSALPVFALLAMITGRRLLSFGIASFGLLLAASSVVPATIANLTGANDEPVALFWGFLLIDTLCVLSLLAFHREAPPVGRRRWLRIFALGAPLVLIASYESQIRPFEASLDPSGLMCLALVAAGLWIAFRRGVPNPAHLLALTCLAGVTIFLRAITLAEVVVHVDNLLPKTSSFGLTMAKAQLTAAIASGALLVMASARSLRGLPSEHPSPQLPA